MGAIRVGSDGKPKAEYCICDEPKPNTRRTVYIEEAGEVKKFNRCIKCGGKVAVA